MSTWLKMQVLQEELEKEKIGSFFPWYIVSHWLSPDLFLISGLASTMGGFRHRGDVILSSGDWTHLQQSHAWRQDFTHFNGYLDRCAWITPGPIQVKKNEDTFSRRFSWKEEFLSRNAVFKLNGFFNPGCLLLQKIQWCIETKKRTSQRCQ